MSDAAFAVRRFSDDFARILRQRILSGEIAGGERLNEVQLASEYGISRSPIREALMVLAGEGLITFVAGKGAFIREITVEEVRQLGEVREALESYAVELVAANATADQVGQLMARQDVTDHAAGSADDDFHALILELSGNERLTQYARHVISRLRMARARSAGVPGRLGDAAAEHAAIAKAIEVGDARTAADAMRAHIRAATESACVALEVALAQQ